MNNFRFTFLCFILLAAGGLVHAQQQSTITVLSAADSLPLEDAFVTVLSSGQNSKSTLLFTDENGQAAIILKSPATVTVQLMGYRISNQSIQPGQSCTFLLPKENYDLNEVVVTGQHDISTTDKSVYPVKVLDKKVIASKAATTLDELLSTELNIRLSQDNILGTGISMNGLSGQNVKILIDGVPVIGRENGNIDISQLNLNDIERVEIIQGPMSVMYGTDALGGLINLITKQSTRHKFEGNLNLNYETVGTYNADGSIYCKNKHQHFSLSGGRYFFGGYPSADSTRFQEWKPWEKYFGAVEYGFKTKWTDGQVRVDYYHQLTQNKGVPTITPQEAYAFDEYYTTNRMGVTVLNRVNLKNAALLQFTGAYSYYQRLSTTYNKDLVTLSQFQTKALNSQDASDFDSYLFRGTYSNSNQLKDFSFQTGYDINLESGRGKKIESNNQQINDFALFGSIEFRMNKFLFRPGLRVAYNSRYGEPVIPSLNLKYKVNDHLQLRTSYSKGFRAPSLKELDLLFVDVNHNILGNENLKAEHSDHYDFSLDYQTTFNKQVIKLDYSVFYNNISDIITLAMVDSAVQQYSYINLNKYKTVGMKVEALWKTGKLNFQSGFSLTGLYNSLSEKYESVKQLSFTPEFTLGASLQLEKIKTVASLYLKNTGTTPGFAVNSQNEVYPTTISSFTMLDLVLQKSLLNERINLSAGIKNLLNVADIKSSAVGTDFHSSGNNFLSYAMGRYYFVKMNFRLYKS